MKTNLRGFSLSFYRESCKDSIRRFPVMLKIFARPRILVKMAVFVFRRIMDLLAIAIIWSSKELFVKKVSELLFIQVHMVNKFYHIVEVIDTKK